MRRHDFWVAAGITFAIAGVVGCSAGPSSAHDAAVPDANGTCGNSFVDPIEECDDGNRIGNDGCSPTCTIETSDLSVTIEQASTQMDPTSVRPITFSVTFSRSVVGFTGGSLSFAGSTAPGTLQATVSGTGASYVVLVSGMTGPGDVVVSIPAGVALDGAQTPNLASTSVDSTVTFAATPATVTIDQASTQDDPTNASPIEFDVVFSQPVTEFTESDVSFSGSTVSGTLAASVSGAGASYVVSVTGMSGAGIVAVSIPASAAINAGGLGNEASTSTDNVVSFAP